MELVGRSPSRCESSWLGGKLSSSLFCGYRILSGPNSQTGVCSAHGNDGSTEGQLETHDATEGL